MTTTSLDNIASRQHTRTLRDRLFALAIAAIVVFGLGAVVASADAVAPTAPTATQAR